MIDMTQKYKELLLKDLSIRLPYGVIVRLYDANDADYDRQLIGEDIDFIELDRRNCKPYLRPMSDMNEEEIKEYKAFHCVAYEHTHFYPQFCTVANELNMFDWLNSHHFDYRSLISKGLAIKAPEGMYNN